MYLVQNVPAPLRNCKPHVSLPPVPSLFIPFPIFFFLLQQLATVMVFSDPLPSQRFPSGFIYRLRSDVFRPSSGDPPSDDRVRLQPSFAELNLRQGFLPALPTTFFLFFFLRTERAPCTLPTLVFFDVASGLSLRLPTPSPAHSFCQVRESCLVAFALT